MYLYFWLGIFVVAMAVVAVGLFRPAQFSKPIPLTIYHTRILVCELGGSADGNFDEDARTYAKYYQNIEKAKVATQSELVQLISEHPRDLVHLFCKLTDDGRLSTEDGSGADGGGLLQACDQSGVKVLILAAGNEFVRYRKAFPGPAKLNFVMTGDRNAGGFVTFLDGILKRMSEGMAMPRAWVDLAPQIPGLEDKVGPSLVFAAGAGHIQLLP